MSEWISVKERLPDREPDSILSYDPVNNLVEEVSVTWLLDFENTITHWMPLPEAPHED